MKTIESFLKAAKLARRQTYKNLTLFPLLAPEAAEPNYLTLEQALIKTWSRSRSWTRPAAFRNCA